MAKNSATLAENAAAKRVDAKTAKPRESAVKSRSRKAAKPTALAGANPESAKVDRGAGAQAYKGSKEGEGGDSPSQLIDARIAELGDWRGETLALVRRLIREADPEVVEEVKWRKPSNGMRGVPVWSHAGIICTGETYKAVVKMTFARGASLADPSGLFNASLDGNVRRAIDFREGDTIDEEALQALIRAAVALNSLPAPSRRRRRAGEAP
jgi:hypothetical protein